MLNIRHFTALECQQEEREDMKVLRRIRAKRTAADKQADLDRAAAALRGEVVTESNSARELRAAGIRIARRYREYMGNRIIRRSVTSLNYDGKPINDLIPYVTINLYCLPTDKELDIIRQVREEATMK